MPIKFVKFALIGGFNTVCDFIIFNIVSGVLNLQPFGIPSVVFGQICSATILTPVSFILNRKFTFQSNVRKRDAFVPFFATNMFTGYVVQTSVVYFVVHILGDAGLKFWWIFNDNQILLNNFGKCWSVAVGMCINFLCYNFIFKQKKSEETKKVESE